MDKPTEAPTVVGGPPTDNSSFVEAAIQAAIDRLQNSHRCRENAIALTHLETALLWLQKRRFDVLTATSTKRAAQRAALWMLLDNIDTNDDACREHDDVFRKRAREQVKIRFDIWKPDEIDGS